MLDEFGPQTIAVSTALSQSPGEVSVAALNSTGKTLADKLFTGANIGGPASHLGNKEAYDFVASYSRLTKILPLSRADYYATAPVEDAAEAARITRLTGALNSLVRYGA